MPRHFIILLTIAGLYLCSRVVQGFPYLLSYFKNVLDIVRFGNHVSYDVRMDKAMGRDYLFIKQIRDVTPENSIVCLWQNDPSLNPPAAAYFLYPRAVKVIGKKDPFRLNSVKKSGCEFLVLSNGFPDFDFSVSGIALFEKDIDNKPVFIKTNNYLHNSIKYAGRIGILRL